MRVFELVYGLTEDFELIGPSYWSIVIVQRPFTGLR